MKRRVSVLLCAVLGLLAVISAPALAAPEPPQTGEATPVGATAATLHGVLNPNHTGEAGTYEFVYRQSEGECTGENEKTAPVPAGTALGHESEAKEVPIAELLPNMPYTFCLRAKSEAGEEALSAPVMFTTLAEAPTIASESASTVEAAAATLEAEIVPEGAAVTYHFDYLTEAQFRVNGEAFTGAETTPESESVGADDAEHAAEARAAGLQPATTYDYRVVATNECEAGKKCVTDGEGKTLTTNPAPGSTTAEACPNEQLRAEQPFGLTLPDCRAYEMVSPLETNGQDATGSSVGSPPRASVSGDAVTYASRGSFADPTGATGENQFLSRREPELGRWSTQSITPLHAPASTESQASYQATAFTPELTKGIADTNAALTYGAPGGKGVQGEFGLYLTDFASSSYQFIGGSNNPSGTSNDLSHVVFGGDEWINGKVVPVAVTNEGESMNASIGAQESSGNGSDVSHAVSSDGSLVYFTSPGIAYTAVEGYTEPGALYVRENTEQEQSKLGTEGGCIESAKACTIEVSASQKTNGSGPRGAALNGSGAARFWGASASGSKVFLTSRLELTNDANTGAANQQEIDLGTRQTYTLTFKGQTTGSISAEATAAEVQSALEGLPSIGDGNVTVTATVAKARVYSNSRPPAFLVVFGGALANTEQPSMTAESANDDGHGVSVTIPGNDLYEYEPSGEDGKPGRLADLTVDKAGSGADVRGVVQISEDGSYVYFVAEGVLTTAKNPRGAQAEAGKPNLYVSHKGGTPMFIATLTPAEPSVFGGSPVGDSLDWEDGYQEGESGPDINTAVVTPDGKRLAFMSERSLTGYDDEQTEAGECEGVIGTSERSEAGKCQEVYLYDAETGDLACASCDPTGSRPIGPASLGHSENKAFIEYHRRNLAEDGALFFNSRDALVPDASDGRQNVYEYEGGHIYPISNVAGGYESFFLDASADGGNVFFATADDLLPQDTGNNVVVWDARVDGGFPVTTSPPSCDNGDSCEPPPSLQPEVFGAPASATFFGPGNPAPPPPAVVKPKPRSLTRAQKLAKALRGCRRDGKRSQRARCQKQARERYGASRATKAGNDRRARQ